MRTDSVKAQTAILVLSILLFCFSVPVFAQNRVVDNAGLLSLQQKETVRRMADSLSAKYNFDLVIVTERTIGNAHPRDYADDFFDYKGYGLGEDRDGCVFLQVTGTRDYWFSTSGRGIELLTPTAYNKLESDAVKHLSAGNPYDAYMSFLSAWDEFLFLDAKWGRHYNFFYRYNSVLTSLSWFLAFIIGFIVVGVWKKEMDTALAQTQASGYIVANSLKFTEKTEQFLYSQVTRSEKPDQTTSSGGGGVHTGSSGRSHGGGGGRY